MIPSLPELSLAHLNGEFIFFANALHFRDGKARVFLPS